MAGPKRKWRPSNVEVPDRVVEAIDRAMPHFLPNASAVKRYEALRIALQAGLQEWAGDRPAWSMNSSAESHVQWLERRVEELQHQELEAGRVNLSEGRRRRLWAANEGR